MGDRPTSRGRPKDPERRARILAAARAAFLAVGFDAASVEAIARDAGVSKVTVYGHFGSLAALLEAVVEAEAEAINAALALGPPSASDLRESLVRFGLRLMRILRERNTLQLEHLVTARSEQQPELVKTYYRSGPARGMGQVESLLRPTLGDRAHEAAQMLFALWNGGEQHRVSLRLRSPMTEQDAEAHVVRCVELIVRAYGEGELAATR